MDLVITEELIARQPPEAQAIIRALLARLAKAEAELELLRRQGPDKTPQNSSLPPSTQHPHAKPVRKRQKSKKRRGGQPGHPKHERPLIPTDQCDDVQTLTRSRLPHDLSYEEAAAALPSQEHLNADETGTKENNTKAWLWTFVARTFTVFAVRTSRAATAVDEFLTSTFCGIVTCDRAKMYWRVGRIQWCWAHLKRDFQGLIDRGDPQARRLWHEGIEPTNNAGERALRHAVIWRKLSFGTQSANGSRFVETMLTVIETCRQQRRNTLEYLTATMVAHFAGRPAPSLLPRP